MNFNVAESVAENMVGRVNRDGLHIGFYLVIWKEGW